MRVLLKGGITGFRELRSVVVMTDGRNNNQQHQTKHPTEKNMRSCYCYCFLVVVPILNFVTIPESRPLGITTASQYLHFRMCFVDGCCGFQYYCRWHLEQHMRIREYKNDEELLTKSLRQKVRGVELKFWLDCIF